ncbi:MAG: RIP metalloprotease RseP [Alphaproteobacteria bacterium]|nr:RIP metalloprotease RseP [Alphaproteobacteria bacterium]
MAFLITVIAFLIVLGIAVLVHELGHYWAARISGVKVLTFSIGFGPSIVKWTDKRGCTWKLSWIPLGGYVQLYGNEDIFDRKKYDALPKAKKKGHYLSAKLWQRIMICIAGVFMNFILAFAIYTGLFYVQPRVVQLPVVGNVVAESIAWNAGVRTGDRIIRVDGKNINSRRDVIIAQQLASERDAMMVVHRRGENVVVRLAPAERWGIEFNPDHTFEQPKTIMGAMHSGAREVYVQSKTILIVLRQIITGERSAEQLGGVILIAELSGKALAAGLIAFLSLIALLSVNFGVLNLLPLPVLDGGTLLMLLTEGITRKKIQGKMLEYIFIGGWIFLLFLFLFVMKNDILRLFS